MVRMLGFRPRRDRGDRPLHDRQRLLEAERVIVGLRLEFHAAALALAVGHRLAAFSNAAL